MSEWKERGEKNNTPPSTPLDSHTHTYNSWWSDYSDRKNDEGDEHVADSLLYDRSHLPRTAPAPDCVARAVAEAKAAQPGTPAPGGE